MLHLEFKPREETIDQEDILRGAALYFDIANLPEWFSAPIITKIVRGVDQSELQGLRVVSPILGDISVRDLSGGCKTLITMYNEPDYVYMSHELGDNCFLWLMEIAKEKEVKLIYSSYFTIPEECEPFLVHIVNDGSSVTTMEELWGKKVELCTYI